MKAMITALALLAITPAFFPSALAQPAPMPVRPNALQEFPPKNGAHITVTSPAFPDGGDIPFENTQYRGNNFPGLAWSVNPPRDDRLGWMCKYTWRSERRPRPSRGSNFF